MIWCASQTRACFVSALLHAPYQTDFWSSGWERDAAGPVVIAYCGGRKTDRGRTVPQRRPTDEFTVPSAPEHVRTLSGKLYQPTRISDKLGRYRRTNGQLAVRQLLRNSLVIGARKTAT